MENQNSQSSEEIVEGLIGEYSTRVYSFCLRLCGNSTDADDLFQQTFLCTFRNRAKLDMSREPLSYIFKICVLQYKNMRRKNARRMAIAPEIYIDDENTPEIASQDDTEKTVLDKFLREEIRKATMSLEDKYRIPVLLYYNQSRSVSEIADILKCPVGTVKSRLFTARNKIKEKLEVLGYDGKEA